MSDMDMSLLRDENVPLVRDHILDGIGWLNNGAEAMAESARRFDAERAILDSPRRILHGPAMRGEVLRLPIPARPLSYQARARRTDPPTSHEAARRVDPNAGTHKRILDLLRMFPPGGAPYHGPHVHEQGGLTDEQIAFWWHDQYDEPISPSGLRSRRNELTRRGLVVDSGQRGKTAAGRSCIVWRLP